MTGLILIIIYCNVVINKDGIENRGKFTKNFKVKFPPIRYRERLMTGTVNWNQLVDLVAGPAEVLCCVLHGTARAGINE